MGYYTSFSLQAKIEPWNVEALVEKLSELGVIGYALEKEYWEDSHGIVEFDSNDTVKWYSHDEDMLKISTAFPNAVFKLIGVGEEPGDIWDTYYKNGQMEYCPYVPKRPEKIRLE